MTNRLILRKLLQSPWLVPLAITVLGFALRMYRIGQESVGHDEAFSLTVSQMPMKEMVAKIVEDFVHPPLHYFALRVWLKWFGFGVVPARLLSVIFGTLAIPMIYLLARELFERQTAAVASLLLAVSQLGIMFSQEARPYAMLLFFALCSSYLFILALRERRAIPWWGFVSAGVLMIYTHYWGGFVVVSLLLYAFLCRKRYALPHSWWIGGAVLSLVLYAPWLASGIVQQAVVNPKTLPGQQGLWFAVHWWTPLSAINAFNNGKVAGLLEPSPLWSFLAGGLLFTAPLLLALQPLVTASEARPSERLHRENLMVLAILWVLPMLLIVGLGAFRVQYNVRYVSFCLAPYYILVARGISGLRSAKQRLVLVLLILTYSGYSLRANYFIPWKENFRDAVAYVLGGYKEGDCCIFLPFPEKISLQWDITQGDSPALKTTTPDVAVSGSESCTRVWVIVTTFGGNPWVRSQREAAERKLEITYSKVELRRYFWLDVTLYSRKGNKSLR